MPTIHNGDRLGPSLLPHRAGNLRLLLVPAGGPSAFERICTLTLVANCLLALWIYFLVPRSMDDPDIWWHLRNAAVQWHSRAWLHHDLYSFTAAGAPWINHEWLAEVPFYLGWRAAGTTGLYIVTLLTIEFILLGVYWLTRMQSERSASRAPVSIALLTTAIAAVLATVSFGPRMLLSGWVCLILELLVLERFYRSLASGSARSDNAIFAMPLLFALWINLHGSWLIGLVLFTTFIAAGSFAFEAGALRNLAWTRSQWQKLGSVLLLSIGALFLNPYGWHLVVYPLDMAFHQPLNIASAEEWKPLDFQTARGLIFLVSLGTLFVAQIIRRLNWTLWELAFAAIGIYAACRHSRFLFLGAMLVMPLLGKQLAHCCVRPAARRRLYSFNRHARPRPWLNAAILAAIPLLLVATRVHSAPPLRLSQPHRPAGQQTTAGQMTAEQMPAGQMTAGQMTARQSAGQQIAGGQPASKFPIAALPFLRHFQPRGRLFNEYLWGGYLAYNVPRIPVFIDSRMDIFERNGTLRDYLDIIYLNRSLALLDEYNIRYVFFEKDTPLVYLLQQTHAWHADYEDSQVILLERLPETRSR